jgi:hypothetical protein
MPNQIQAGTMMVQQSTIPRSLGVESELYCQNWRSLGTLESSRLDQKVRAAGWNLFFMVGELRAVAPAWGGQNSLRRGVKRLLAQTQLQHFNCLELGHILRKRFLGIPYISIAAHPRHIQQGCQMQSVEQRAQSGADALERRSSSGDTPEGLNIEGCLQN